MDSCLIYVCIHRSGTLTGMYDLLNYVIVHDFEGPMKVTSATGSLSSTMQQHFCHTR